MGTPTGRLEAMRSPRHGRQGPHENARSGMSPTGVRSDERSRRVERRPARSSAQVARNGRFMLRSYVGSRQRRAAQVGHERGRASQVAGGHVGCVIGVTAGAVRHVHADLAGIRNRHRHRHLRRHRRMRDGARGENREQNDNDEATSSKHFSKLLHSRRNVHSQVSEAWIPHAHVSPDRRRMWKAHR